MKYVPLLSASLLALGVAATAHADTLKKVADSGKLTLAYRESSVPFSYVEGPGKPLGFSMDIANAVVQGLMDVQLETGVPVFSAVLTPHHFHSHAEHQQFFGDHFVHKGAEVAQACLATVASLRKLAAL